MKDHLHIFTTGLIHPYFVHLIIPCDVHNVIPKCTRFGSHRFEGERLECGVMQYLLKQIDSQTDRTLDMFSQLSVARFRDPKLTNQ